MPTSNSTIPQRPEDLTADWLTDALRASGVLASARVTDVEAQREGQGLGSQLLRLRLRYDRSESGAPETLIAKLPSDLATNRATAESVGAYEREILFYRELAEEVEIRTPRHYYSAMDPNPRERSGDRLERLVEWMPSPLLAYLPGMVHWLAKRSKRRYLLLLEDLAPARVGDQAAGCTPEEAGRALQALAATQARFWQSPRLGSLPWLAASKAAPRVRQAMFRRLSRRFRDQAQEHSEALGGPLPESMLVACDWLRENGLALHAHLASPPLTLLHGDYRLDNLFFDAPQNGASVAAVDWAMVHSGRAPADAAFFLSCSLDVEVARQAEPGLVEGYHAALVAGGVKDYDLAECRRDYELSKLVMVELIVLSAGRLEIGEAQAAALADSFIRRLAALLPTRDLDALLR
jgi:hypothetical protein